MKNTDFQHISSIPAYIEYSGWITVLLGTISLVLDWHFQNEIFQRCGALIVGYSVCHFFSHDHVKSVLDANRAYIHALGKFVPIPNGGGSIQDNPHLYSKAQQSLSDFYLTTISTAPDAGSKSIDWANSVIVEVEKHRSSASENFSSMNKLRKKEIMLAITGTLIWAFGDWITNLMFHCHMLSCGC